MLPITLNPNVDMHNTIEFITTLARQTGALLLDFYQTETTQASLKADNSVVTQADLSADQFIAAELLARFPGEPILSEELAPALDQSENQVLWVIDPLDGTTNFSLGLPFWGVSIARLKNGYPELGVLYFPCLDELYTASRGAGANLNSRRLHVQPPDPSQPWSFFSCCSRTFRDYEISIKYKPRILGSAAYSFCCVARGISLISFEATPKLWDFAAAWLVVEEAGGYVATLDGSQPFPPVGVEDHSRVHYPILAAATPELLEKGRKQIRKRA
jgi:myo-inositol-1(or 4)-monophosphatase